MSKPFVLLLCLEYLEVDGKRPEQCLQPCCCGCNICPGHRFKLFPLWDKFKIHFHAAVDCKICPGHRFKLVPLWDKFKMYFHAVVDVKFVTVTGLKFFLFVAVQMPMKFQMVTVTYFVSVSLFLSVRFCVCYKHKALEKLLEALVLWILASHHKGCRCPCLACVREGCLSVRPSVSSFMKHTLCEPQRFVANSNLYFFNWSCISLNCRHCWIAKPTHIFNCPTFNLQSPMSELF